MELTVVGRPETERTHLWLPTPFGSAVRATANSRALATLWSDFIDWDKRRQGERGVLSQILRGYGCERVFDAALGDGCDAIHLSRERFQVHGNEIDVPFRTLAQRNARVAGVNFRIHGYNWFDLPSRFEAGTFDAVLCLGNSLTLLLSARDRHAALRAFWHVLRPNGVLLIDERNYQYMLNFRRDVAEGRFEYKHQHVYCGSNVDARPIVIADHVVVMQYVHREFHACGHLALYPFQDGQLRAELEGAGFAIAHTFSDYCSGRRKESDFFTYAALKRPD